MLTNVRLVFRQHSYHIVVQGGTHELFRDLAGTKTVKLFGHVDGWTFAKGENLADEFLKFGVNNGSIDWQ